MFFLRNGSVPSFFSGQKKSLPLHLNWVKSTLQIIQKGCYDYAQWWVVVNRAISKHMTHSASSVIQESINNKKALNVISAKKSLCPVIFFVKKSVGPVIFFFKKSLCPVTFFLKKSACPPVILPSIHSNNFCPLPNIFLKQLFNVAINAKTIKIHLILQKSREIFSDI